MSRKRKKAEPVAEEPIAEQEPLAEAPTAAEEPPVEETPVEEASAEETSAEGETPAEGETVPEEPMAADLRWQLPQILEAILFASPKPCTAKELQGIVKGAAGAAPENPDVAAFAKVREPQIKDALEELAARCATAGGVYELGETAAGWQLVTRADFFPWLRQIYPENRSARLSAPAMETLAIIAYRQPITRADIEAVRGVAVDGVMQTLLDRGLVKIAGRAEIPGRPLLYETTQFFMEHFGLCNLDELPNADELRKIELPKAEIPAEEPPAAPPAGEVVAAEEPAAETEAAPPAEENTAPQA